MEINPSSHNDQLFSLFVQDEITLIDDALWVTVGSKFEHNDYTGFEVQPTARVIWAPHHQHRLWGAVSRAVRTPSRVENDIIALQSVTPPQSSFLPAIAAIVEGNHQFDSEEVISYEMGYRTTFINNFSIDFTTFYNNYRNLRSGTNSSIIFPTNSVDPAYIIVKPENNNSADTYGVEIATVWQMLDWWQWNTNYSFIKTNYGQEAAIRALGSSPQNRISIRSVLSPWDSFDFDVLFRYVDSNKAISNTGLLTIKDYISMDVRLAWRPVKDIELSIVGQNLLSEKHLEYKQAILTSTTAIDRGMYGKLTWHF